jgi:hypothetical protein
LRALLITLSLIAAVAAACGGGGSGGGSDEQQAGAAANRHIRTFLGLFDGTSTSQQLIDAFAPECRSGVKTTDIDKTAALLRTFAPQFAKYRIEAIDLGPLSYEKTADGINVTATDGTKARIKTNGKWISVQDYVKLANLESGDLNITGGEPTLMVKRDGKWYIGDCSVLEDLKTGLD